MRILVLSSTFPRWEGDTEPGFVLELCKRLADRDFGVDVLAPHTAKASTCEKFGGINVFRYKYFFTRFQKLAYNGGINANIRKYWYARLLVPLFIFFQCLAIYRRLKEDHYDIIHAHWIIPQALCCSLLFRIVPGIALPVICTSHGGDLYSYNSGFSRYIKKRVINDLAHLCVVSNAMKEEAVQLGAAGGKVNVLSMGVDLSARFKPVKGVMRDPQKIIFVGRFVEKKGINLLIDAVSLLRKQYPEVELVLVGDGPGRRRAREQVVEHGMESSVEFHGSMHQSALPALFSSAAIAVVPSVIDNTGDREGLGLVVIEAMGCECAVVVSSLAAMQDIVTDGETGLIFQMGSAEDLRDRLQYLLQQPHERQLLAERGREFVRSRYDWDIIAGQYQVLLQNFKSS